MNVIKTSIDGVLYAKKYSMKRDLFLLFLLLYIPSFAIAQDWEPAGDKIKTRWADLINPQDPLPEYPRPQLERSDWMSLNGLWRYAICSADSKPKDFEGNILVPFPIESSLSGVMKVVESGKCLWYSRSFSIPDQWKGKDILLNFGAVDYETDVFLNGIFIGKHIGGYSSFSFNISKEIIFDGDNLLEVKVKDETDENTQVLGKQRRNPAANGSIWYTSITGIWQTVWLEPVAHTYIENVFITSDIDNSEILLDLKIKGDKCSSLCVKIYDGKDLVTECQSKATQIVCPVNKPHLWSPSDPHIYNVDIELICDELVVDHVNSYIGMRKISTCQDKNGLWHIQLNNENYFQLGLLDQGYWPDGLYTAPTDEALSFDIEKTKELGFNLIRKHMKVEPDRWYYHCDRLGVLVWQDMPAIKRSDQEWIKYDWYLGTVGSHANDVEERYKKELKDIISQHYSNPCIVVWVPFNEAWGQFKTEEIVELIKHEDATRLVNAACGGNHFHTGDMLSIHDYARPPSIFLYDNLRPTVLGEYGGLGFNVVGHRWEESDSKTYVNYKSTKELTDAYVENAMQVLRMAKGIADENGHIKSICAAIYTQTTDVETELNGMMTYDRYIDKMDIGLVQEMNKKFLENISDVTSLNRITQDDSGKSKFFSLGGILIDDIRYSYQKNSKQILIKKGLKLFPKFVND